MIQPIHKEMQVGGVSTMFPDAGAALTPVAALRLTTHKSIGTMVHPARAINSPQQRPSIDTDDWDALFCAVQTQLKHAVGEQLGVLPHTPAHSINMAATLVQAIVLDCVSAMEQLHAALKQERSQRPTD